MLHALRARAVSSINTCLHSFSGIPRKAQGAVTARTLFRRSNFGAKTVVSCLEPSSRLRSSTHRWFPRAPGIYWSRHAQFARKDVYSGQFHTDAELGKYFSPQSKMDLIEEGGIGTIRLRPRRIDGEDSWMATALSGIDCHSVYPWPFRLLSFVRRA